MIFNTNAYPRDQEKMSKLYMNRFAIDEDEQFEIHFKDVNQYESYDRTKTLSQKLCHKDVVTKYQKNKDIYHAVKEVMLKAQQGSGDCHLN